MPKRFATTIDLMGLALINAMMNPLSSDPTGLAAGDAGRLWINTTVPTLKFWNGTAPIDLLARANATGTQTASTISNFTAAVNLLPWASMAAPSGAVPMASQNFSSLGTASSAGQAVEYAQFNTAIANVQAGLDIKERPAAVVMTTNLASLAAPGSTINGHTMIVGDAILLAGQTLPAANGVYNWNGAAVAMTRRSDASSNASVFSGTMVTVGAGDSTNPDTVWMQTSVGTAAGGAITMGTDSMVWIKPFTTTTYTQGNGITISAGVIAALAVAGAQAADTAVPAQGGLTVGGSGSYLDPATAVRKVYGTIPISTTGIYTITGGTVTIADGIPNINKKFVLKAGTGAIAIGGVTPATGEEVIVGSTTTTTNTVVVLPATPVSNQWTYEIIG